MKKDLVFMLACTALAPVAGAAAESTVFKLGEISTSAVTEAANRPGADLITAEDIRQFDRDTLDEALILAPGTSLTAAPARCWKRFYGTAEKHKPPWRRCGNWYQRTEIRY